MMMFWTHLQWRLFHGLQSVIVGLVVAQSWNAEHCINGQTDGRTEEGTGVILEWDHKAHQAQLDRSSKPSLTLVPPDLMYPTPPMLATLWLILITCGYEQLKQTKTWFTRPLLCYFPTMPLLSFYKKINTVVRYTIPIPTTAPIISKVSFTIIIDGKWQVFTSSVKY